MAQEERQKDVRIIVPNKKDLWASLLSIPDIVCACMKMTFFHHLVQLASVILTKLELAILPTHEEVAWVQSATSTNGMSQ